MFDVGMDKESSSENEYESNRCSEKALEAFCEYGAAFVKLVESFDPGCDIFDELILRGLLELIDEEHGWPKPSERGLLAIEAYQIGHG